MKYKFIAAMLLPAFFFSLVSPAFSQSAGAPASGSGKSGGYVISEIVVQGNKLVNTNTILNKLKSQPGGKLIQKVVNDDIKRLYGTGFFQDIRVEVEEQAGGYKLIFTVDEKPIVRQIVIDGAKIIKTEKLRKEIALVEGQILDPKIIKEGVNKIKQKYVKKGFRFVNVRWEMDVNQETKEATVYIIIKEGQKYRIQKVSFAGVKAFKEKALIKKMKTKKKGIIRRGIYNEEKFRGDLDMIMSQYQDNGYLDVRVEPEFEYDEAENRIKVLIKVEEGSQYLAGDVKVQGNVLFPKSDIWQRMSMLPGTVYSQRNMVGDIEAIRKFYFEKGYIDVRILPETHYNKKNGRVDVSYDLKEGDLYFVDKVKIRGNTKTKDKVIRRELRLRPGERFDGKKLDTSIQRLNNLGYFQEADYDTEPGSAANKRDVVFRVKEKQTGELSFGAGVSSIENFIGFAEIAQRNFDLMNWPRFTGGGQSVSLRGRFGSDSRDFDFNFTEPYLFNKNVGFNFNIFDINRFANNVDFDEERLGAGFNLSRYFTDRVSSSFGYTLEQVTLDSIPADAHPDVLLFTGDTVLSRVRWSISRDTRDNVFNPNKGSLINFSSELIGSVVGGDEDYYIVSTSYTKYVSFLKEHLLEFRFRLATAEELGSSTTVPVFDRFYAGGLGTVRGFDYRRVGPKGGGDAIGGQTLGIFNFEYTWPIITNFKGAVFFDVGQVDPESYKLSGGDYAASIGPGLKIKTPIGPVVFYYGFPIAGKDEEDSNGRFEFAFSRGF